MEYRHTAHAARHGMRRNSGRTLCPRHRPGTLHSHRCTGSPPRLPLRPRPAPAPGALALDLHSWLTAVCSFHSLVVMSTALPAKEHSMMPSRLRWGVRTGKSSRLQLTTTTTDDASSDPRAANDAASEAEDVGRTSFAACPGAGVLSAGYQQRGRNLQQQSPPRTRGWARRRR